jgi:hypothetical protein
MSRSFRTVLASSYFNGQLHHSEVSPVQPWTCKRRHGTGQGNAMGVRGIESCELRAAADKDLMISAVPCWWSQRDSREKHSSMPPSPPLGTFRSTAAADLSALSAECSGSVCLNSARPNSCSILVVGLVTSAAVGQ